MKKNKKNQKNHSKKVKRHIKWKSFFLFLFLLLFFLFGGYYIMHLRISRIVITGTNLLRDKDVIEVAGIKDYPKMTKYSIRTLEKAISSLDLVSNVHVKKSILGKLTIQIDEAKVLFFNRNISAYVLSNGKETVEGDFVGIPFLVNYVPDSIYERLIKDFSKINPEAIAMISEIEYAQSKSGEIVIDDTRFLLRMNDGNQVFINLINIDRMNMYGLIYTGLTEKGVLELDSDNDRVVFSPCTNIVSKGDVTSTTYQHCAKLLGVVSHES